MARCNPDLVDQANAAMETLQQILALRDIDLRTGNPVIDQKGGCRFLVGAVTGDPETAGEADRAWILGESHQNRWTTLPEGIGGDQDLPTAGRPSWTVPVTQVRAKPSLRRRSWATAGSTEEKEGRRGF